MEIAERSIAVTALLICLFWTNTYASTSRAYTYLSNPTITGPPPVKRLNFMFAQQLKDSTEVEFPNSLKHKSPYMAVFYSVIPGVLVHGSGHFYAGKGGTGTTLLGLEAAGALLLYFGSLSAFQGSSHQNDTDAMGYIGLALFAGSWVYDIVGSPIVIVKRNRYINEIRGSQYDIDRQQRELKLTFVWHF